MENFLNQIDSILKDAEKKAEGDIKLLAPLAMYKVMIRTIVKFIENEAKKNEEFKNALSLNHKSAARMLKYVWGEARKLAMPSGNGSSCCIPDAVVFEWVYNYYLLDDKAEVEAELKAKAKADAEAKAKAEKEAEIEAKAREKAITKLSEREDFNELSEEEKEKIVKNELYDIKKKMEAAEKRKAKKKEEKTVSINKTTENIGDAENANTVDTDVVDTDAVENTDTVDTTEIKDAPNIMSLETSLEAVSEIEQFSLFDLMK